MRIKREEFLRALESVSPGLAKREAIEQSSCFAFANGRITTYNEEIACSVASLMPDMVGAVLAEPLMNTLGKWVDEDIDVELGEGELLLCGSGRRAGIRMERDVVLPISNVELPTVWKPVNPEFADAVGIVKECAGTDDQHFALTCLHITPTYIEACDNLQMLRYPLVTGFEPNTVSHNGDVREMGRLIRRDSVRHIAGLGMTEFCESPTWLHFRNSTGLMFSCRRYADDYPSLDNVLGVDGTPMTLPGGLSEVVDRAEVFSTPGAVNNIIVELRSGKIKIEGRGPAGWFSEIKEVKYSGEQLRFMISSRLLRELSKLSTECRIAPGRLKIDTGKFACVCSLGKPT